MDADDFMEPEVAAAAAATAAVLSPAVRNVLHKGAVYGVTGVLLAGDALWAFGRGLTRGLSSAASSPVPAPGLPRAERAPSSRAETDQGLDGIIFEQEET